MIVCYLLLKQRFCFGKILNKKGFDTLLAASGEEALEILADRAIKVIVCDERMPGMSGAELLSIVNVRHPATVRIMLTGYATLESAMKAVNEGGICRFFSKPWNDFELKFAIRSAIEKYDQEIMIRKLMALVRTQHFNLKQLEHAGPGIQPSGKSADGSFYMPELTDQEIARILKECLIG